MNIQPFTNLFPTKREPFQLVSDKIHMELVLDYKMELVALFGMNGPKFDLMQSPIKQPAYKTNGIQLTYDFQSNKKNRQRILFNYPDAKPFNRDNGQCSQQCHDNTDNERSWNYSKTESFKQMMTKCTGFKRIEKLKKRNNIRTCIKNTVNI